MGDLLDKVAECGFSGVGQTLLGLSPMGIMPRTAPVMLVCFEEDNFDVAIEETEHRPLAPPVKLTDGIGTEDIHRAGAGSTVARDDTQGGTVVGQKNHSRRIGRDEEFFVRRIKLGYRAVVDGVTAFLLCEVGAHDLIHLTGKHTIRPEVRECFPQFFDPTIDISGLLYVGKRISVSVTVEHQREGDLPGVAYVRGGFHPLSYFPHHGDYNGRENTNNSDHRKQFHQGKRAAVPGARQPMTNGRGSLHGGEG